MLELGDPGQILALSPFAVDRALSFHAERAGAYRRVTDSAETVLTLDPDLVLASGFNNPSTLAFLRRRGVPVYTLSFAKGLEDIEQQAREIASVLGQVERGEAFVARVEAARTQSVAQTGEGRQLAALYLERGGYVAGKDSLMDDLFKARGIENAAARPGSGMFFRPLAASSVEAVLMLRPDFLVVGDDGAEGSGEGAGLLRHPALAKAYPAQLRLNWPVRETVCPGPSVISALERLSDGVGRIRGGGNSLARGTLSCTDATVCSDSSAGMERP